MALQGRACYAQQSLQNTGKVLHFRQMSRAMVRGEVLGHRSRSQRRAMDLRVRDLTQNSAVNERSGVIRCRCVSVW